MSNFNFTEAQKYELEWQTNYIKETFQKEWDEWRERQSKPNTYSFLKHFAPVVDPEIVDHIRKENNLEIGCGSVPLIKELFDSVYCDNVIDPLAKEYEHIQTELFGKSFFDGMNILSLPAEVFHPIIEGSVRGCIICRNALDHMEDPLKVLYNISRYAASGCYLLLWTDIWHHDGGNEGHRSITKSKEAMEAYLKGLGFERLYDAPTVRTNPVYEEFGGTFIKL